MCKVYKFTLSTYYTILRILINDIEMSINISLLTKCDTATLLLTDITKLHCFSSKYITYTELKVVTIQSVSLQIWSHHKN
jgi:hypothetical protein